MEVAIGQPDRGASAQGRVRLHCATETDALASSDRAACYQKNACGRPVAGVIFNMKTRSFFAVLALGSLALAGCTATTETTTTTTAQTNPSKRAYSQDELQSSGEAQTGPALERTDPAITERRTR